MREIRIAGNSTAMILPFLSVRIGGEKSVDWQTQTLPAVVGLSQNLSSKKIRPQPRGIGSKPAPKAVGVSARLPWAEPTTSFSGILLDTGETWWRLARQRLPER
jgi:hypothetical protein